MPAAIMHGGGVSVLLMMTIKLATQEQSRITKLKMNAMKAPSLITKSNPKRQHKITGKPNNEEKRPAPSTIPGRCSSFK